MDTNRPRVFEVGGAVRDAFLGLPTKDVDFSVSGVANMDELAALVEDMGHRVVHVRPEFFTVVASVAKDHPLRERTASADFVMCRKDSKGSDGRRPDFVEPGTVFDDLARRDFTVNAMALDTETGELLDPHEGRRDLENRTLRFVGDPAVRCEEDGVRVMRALRFMVQKGLTPDPVAEEFLLSQAATDALAGQHVDMLSKELQKAGRFDSAALVLTLGRFPNLLPALFRDGLHLDGSLKQH